MSNTNYSEKAGRKMWVKTRRICGGFPVENIYENTYHFGTEEECRDFIIQCDEDGDLIYDDKNDLVWLKADTMLKITFYRSGNIRINLGFIRIKCSKLWVDTYFNIDFTRVFKAGDIADAFRIDRKLYEMDNEYGRVCDLKEID